MINGSLRNLTTEIPVEHLGARCLELRGRPDLQVQWVRKGQLVRRGQQDRPDRRDRRGRRARVTTRLGKPDVDCLEHWKRKRADALASRRRVWQRRGCVVSSCTTCAACSGSPHGHSDAAQNPNGDATIPGCRQHARLKSVFLEGVQVGPAPDGWLPSSHTWCRGLLS